MSKNTAYWRHLHWKVETSLRDTRIIKLQGTLSSRTVARVAECRFSLREIFGY